MGLGDVLSNFDGTNAFGATNERIACISTLYRSTAKDDTGRLFAD